MPAACVCGLACGLGLRPGPAACSSWLCCAELPFRRAPGSRRAARQKRTNLQMGTRRAAVSGNIRPGIGPMCSWPTLFWEGHTSLTPECSHDCLACWSSANAETSAVPALVAGLLEGVRGCDHAGECRLAWKAPIKSSPHKACSQRCCWELHARRPERGLLACWPCRMSAWLRSGAERSCAAALTHALAAASPEATLLM